MSAINCSNSFPVVDCRWWLCGYKCYCYFFVLLWASMMSKYHWYPCTMIACEETYGENSIWDAVRLKKKWKNVFGFGFGFILILILITIFMGFAFFAFLEWITDVNKNLRYLSAISVKELKITLIYWNWR
jgi:hypothetical protein